MAQGMQAVASILCDIVVKLGDDLKVVGSGPALGSFFGEPMEGKLFSDMVFGEYQEKFSEACVQAAATHIPQSMPIKLNRSFGCAEAQLLIVHTGSSQSPWLLGIRAEDVPYAPRLASADIEQPRSIPAGLRVSPEQHESEATFTYTHSSEPRSASVKTLDVSEAFSVGTQTQSAVAQLSSGLISRRDIGVATEMVWAHSCFECTACTWPATQTRTAQPEYSMSRDVHSSSSSRLSASHTSDTDGAVDSRDSTAHSGDIHSIASFSNDIMAGHDFLLKSCLSLRGRMLQSGASFEVSSEGTLSEDGDVVSL